MPENTKVTDPVLDSDAVINSLSGAPLTQATVAPTDKVLIQDTDDSDNLKYSSFNFPREMVDRKCLNEAIYVL